MKSLRFDNYYHLVDESPRPFLVSTASLFLILNAVLFFHFDFESEFSLCLVSFMSLALEAKPKILYLGGSVLANQAYTHYRSYSFRPLGIGNAKWDPNNYSVETQSIILNLLDYLNKCDKDSAYDVMYAILGNKNGIFTQSYGKVTSVINNIIYFYNKKNPQNQITEKGFLDRYGFNYHDNDLKFLDSTNRGTVMTNISEFLAPQVVMNQNSNLLVERCVFLSDKANLSFQGNPEYTIGIFAKNKVSNEITLIVYDSDFKLTDPFSFCQKLSDLSRNGVFEKSILGMNIVMMASFDNQDSDIIFNEENRGIIIKHLQKLSKQYPEHFKNFNESEEFLKKFAETGDANYLNKSHLPVVRFYRPNEFYKLAHQEKKFEETPVYILLTETLNTRQNLKKTNSPLIEEVTKDDIDI